MNNLCTTTPKLPKNLLFITWDSDSSNYLETLFFPILSGLQARGVIHPFVCQFSWADESEVDRIASIASGLGIGYLHRRISRKPHPALGSLLAVRSSRKALQTFILENKIEILMPRSTMPAWIVSRLPGRLIDGLELVFDADGFPIQERVDFSGLLEGSLMHRFLRRLETGMLQKADKILVRTRKSNRIHLHNVPDLPASKFFKVGNGRSETLFFYDHPRPETRAKLGVRPDELLLVHSGSLGGGSETDRMFALLQTLLDGGTAAKLLFLTRDEKTARSLIPHWLHSNVLVASAEFHLIPELLRASDVGIYFRKKAPSIAGISPIKLGEYLMCGLPVLISEGIGDLDELLSGLPFVWTARESYAPEEFLNWQRSVRTLDRAAVAKFGRVHFSLESTLDSYQQALNL